jgi:hypothetical protein
VSSLESGWVYALTSAPGGRSASEYDYSVQRASTTALGMIEPLPSPAMPPGTRQFQIDLLAVSDRHVFTTGLLYHPEQRRVLGSVLYRIALPAPR